MKKKALITTILLGASLYANAQSQVLQERLKKQKETTKQEITIQETTKTIEEPTKQTLETIIDLGEISIGDQVNTFKIRVDEQQGTLIKEPRDLLLEGTKIGELHYQDNGLWQYDGILKDLSLGDNYFTTTFTNDLGLKSPVKIKLTTTNQAPIPEELNYTFSSKTGEQITGTTKPTKTNGEYIYHIGDVFGKYFLSDLTINVKDEDENLTTENIFININDVVVGSFKEKEKGTFQYERDETQNRGLGAYRINTTFTDKVGADANINIFYRKTGEPPKVLDVEINTERGINTQINYEETHSNEKTRGTNK